MKRSKFSEEQIIGVLKGHEAGLKMADLCRKHGISEATFGNWTSKHGGLEVSEAKRLRALESDNARLKKLLQNAFIESFNGRLRDEFLNEALFTSLDQTRAALEEWRRDYNTVRPHSDIGWLTPDAYAAQFFVLRGQGAALTAGSAPRLLTTDQTDEFNCQTLATTG
jgi:putative transposase